MKIFLVIIAVIIMSVTTSAQVEVLKADRASILKASEAIIKEVGEMRGLPARAPAKSGFKSRKDLEAIIIRGLDEERNPEELEIQTKFLKRLGLIPKDYNLRDEVIKLLSEQIGGFYDPRTGEFYLVDWLSLDEQKPVMAHELMHAIQDQNFNLRRFEKAFKEQSDQELAVQSLVEGEATVVMFNYMFRASGVDITKVKIPLKAMFEATGNDARFPVLASVPRVVRESLEFPYFYGAAFVHNVVYNSSWKRIDESYKDLPESTEQIMHPEKFLKRESPVKVILKDVAETLGTGWKRVETDVNGEFGLYLILTEFMEKGRAQAAAEGWGGDQYIFYEHTNKKDTALVMMTTWDSEADALEFFEAYCDRTANRYADAKTLKEGENLRVYDSSEGGVLIERRRQGVLVIDGAPVQQLEKLQKELWEKSEVGRK